MPPQMKILIMNKIILTFAVLSLLVFGGDVYAQEGATDGFFKSNYEMYREENLEWGSMPLLPRTHGYVYDYAAADPESAPIGSGWLLLGAMGMGYLTIKKKN